MQVAYNSHSIAYKLIKFRTLCITYSLFSTSHKSLRERKSKLHYFIFSIRNSIKTSTGKRFPFRTYWNFTFERMQIRKEHGKMSVLSSYFSSPGSFYLNGAITTSPPDTRFSCFPISWAPLSWISAIDFSTGLREKQTFKI